MIHNFKNYVLRPGESGYYLGAVANYDQAVDLLIEIQYLGKQYLGAVHLDETRAMLNEYRSRLEELKARSQFRASARDNDAQVRFDDSRAVTELDQLSVAISESLEQGIATQSQQTLSASLLIYILSLTALVLNVRFYPKQVKEDSARKVEQFERRNRELSVVNESLQRFAAIVAHDLKAPIRLIDSFADAVLDETKPDDPHVQHLRSIYDSSGKLTRLIDSLLRFTQESYREPIRTGVLQPHWQ